MLAVANCPSCGARVDASPGAAAFVYTCRFCGARIPIDPLGSPGAGIPQIVRIQAEEPRTYEPARRVKASGQRASVVVLLSTLLPFVILIGVFAGPTLWGMVAGRYADFPMTVPLNGSLEIDDRTATGTDTMVTLGVNGKVTLRRCHLKGPLLVKAGINGEVTIIDSVLEGTKGIVSGGVNLVVTIQNSTVTSGDAVVSDEGDAKIDISKGSKVEAAGVAFPLEVNGEVAIDHSSVEGKIGGVAIKVNGHVKMTDGATVSSDGPAIELPMNGHLAITASRVESKTEAIVAASNVEGTLRSSVLVGPRGAVDIGSNGRLTLAQMTLTGPKRVSGSARLDERD